MAAAVVDGFDFDIERVEAAVTVLVLNPSIGELNVAVLVGQIVFDGPSVDLVGTPIWPAVAVGATTIALLKKLLVVALQLVVEDDAADDCVVLPEPFGLLLVRAVDLRIVRQLARSS